MAYVAQHSASGSIVQPLEGRDPRVSASRQGRRSANWSDEARDRRVSGELGSLVLRMTVLLVVAVVVVFALSGVLTRIGGAPKRGLAAGAPTRTTLVHTVISVAQPAHALVETTAKEFALVVLDGVASGLITPGAGSQLADLLRPLLRFPDGQVSPRVTADLHQLALTFSTDVRDGQIAGAPTIDSLESALASLAVTLGPAVAATTSHHDPSATTTTAKGRHKTNKIH